MEPSIRSASHETSREGVNAEWRVVCVLTVEGNLIDRLEVFDEAELDTAIARFEELDLARRVANTASRVVEEFFTHFAVRDWDAMAELLADDVASDDRRAILNAGIRRGRDAEMANWRATSDLWSTLVRSTIATRGERLGFYRFAFASQYQPSDAFSAAALAIVEINEDNRISWIVVFDLDDVDAAFEELDSRYLAGEAAAHAPTWSVIARAFAALNQHELPPITPGWVNIDHRPVQRVEADDLGALIRATWDVVPHGRVYIEAVHRLNDVGVATTYVARGTSQEGFDAEWRAVNISTVDGDMISRSEVFDEGDIDSALATFDQLSLPALRLKNSVAERLSAHIAARDWDGLAQDFADDYCLDDRRRVVNAGVMHGRDAGVEATRVAAELALLTNMTSTIIASRGERLTLERFHATGPDHESIQNDALNIVEIDADERIAAVVMFDLDDIDAAIAELDGLYLAGEAAGYGRTWSTISQAYAALNRRALPATTPDWTSIDHRRFGTVEANALTPNIRAWWNLTSEARIDIEAVHRLTNRGAVVTHINHATWHEGAEIESREIVILTVEGDLLSRCEIFDEARLDTALARFDELSLQTRRLINSASHLCERFQASFAARDWDAMAGMLADDLFTDDRRRVVNAGIRHGRDAEIENYRAAAEIGIKYITLDVIATRGERLVLGRVLRSQRDQLPETFAIEVLGIVEINADERIVAVFSFDLDDIDAAFEELDARYVAGEAAEHAHAWSVIARINAAFNRHELSAADWITIDHRRLETTDTSNMPGLFDVIWDLTPNLSIHIEAVHRLSSFGAVVTRMARGTSREGFDAEWRMIHLLIVEGDRISRCEVFDETDLDGALARFEELQPQAPRLKNAASQVNERFWSYFAARDWAAMAETLGDNFSSDDRRRIVNAGVQHGRDNQIADMRALAEVEANIMVTVVAIRGERLVLTGLRSSNRDLRHGEFGVEMLAITEIDGDNRFAATIVFDADDIDTAYEELEARYLAGEAAAHRRIWSAIVGGYAALNRHEVPPTTPDWVNVDHRRGIAFASGELAPYIRATFDVVPDTKIHIEVVHRLSNVGAVLTHTACGSSQQGFDAVWRETALFTVDGDLVNRCEMFDEADIDAALVRFEELHSATRQLVNTATRVYESLHAYFVARDWDAITGILADGYYQDDRRPVVGSPIRHGQNALLDDLQAATGLGITNAAFHAIATRGERLAFTHARYSRSNAEPDAFYAGFLQVVEIDAQEQITALAAFDLDDFEAAVQDLDARYLAGEAAAHAHTWSVIAAGYAALNRREQSSTTPDFVQIDHRLQATVEAGELDKFLRATWELMPDLTSCIEAVHRLSDRGAVVTHAGRGTSQQGFHAEWRETDVLTVEGEMFSRCEIFHDANLDAALARFDELQSQARLENAATRADDHFFAYFGARNWAALAETLAEESFIDDRRPVVNAGLWNGREDVIANLRAVVDAAANITSVIATRGERLALSRIRSSNRDPSQGEFGVEMLNVVEIDSDERIVAHVEYDVDELEAAFAELDARYLASEAAAYAHTWSVMARECAGFNRHELPAADWVTIDHRQLAVTDATDQQAALRAIWDVTPDLSVHIEAVHRLNNLGALATYTAYGTSPEGLVAEWRMIFLLTVEGDRINSLEVFDETDIDTALARFDELDQPSPSFENAATRTWVRAADAFNRRDVEGLLALASADSRYEDRRKGLRDVVEGPGRQKALEAMFEAAPSSWRMQTEPVAIRGSRLSLTRACYRDIDDADRPIAVELLHVMELGDDELMRDTVIFDPDDINSAFAELTARWIASGEVAYPKLIEAVDRLNATINRHDLDAVATHFAGAEYVNHRQLAQSVDGTIDDWLSSMQTTKSLVPDLWVELAEVLARCAIGIVGRMALKGTSTDGAAIEIPFVVLLLLDGERVTRLEAFDEDQRDMALARLQELSRPV